MSDWFLLTLAILACYRLAMLVTQDEIARPVRNAIGLHPWGWVRDHLGYLVHCPYCIGVWLALGLALLLRPGDWLLYWLAVAGGQAALQKLGDRVDS